MRGKDKMICDKRQWMQKRSRFVFCCLVLCFLAFSVQIVNECTNVWDGLWNGSYEDGPVWQIRIGRWFWPVIAAGRLRLSPDPLMSIFTLVLFVLAGCSVISLFSLWESPAKHLILLSFLITPVMSIILSYRYMSPTFGMSMLLNAAGIWLLCKGGNLWGWLGGTCCLVLALGTYQAYIACALVIFLVYFIHMLLSGEEPKKLLLLFIRVAASVLVACIAYKLIWQLALLVIHQEAASYRGADQITVGSIFTALPRTIASTYRECWNYFTGNGFWHNAYQKTMIYPLAGAAFLVLSVFAILKDLIRSRIRAVFVVLCFALLPLAANITLVLAPDAGSMDIQMATPLTLFAPLFLCLCYRAGNAGTAEKEQALPADRKINLQLINRRYVLPVLACFILFGNFLQVCMEQHTMLWSRDQTLSFMNRVVADLEKQELLSGEHEMIFVGIPARNPLVKGDSLFEKANGRSNYANVPTGRNTSPLSYGGIARDGGFQLPLVRDSNRWNELEARAESQALPAYPAEGYWTVVDDVLVVKLSN